MTSDRTILITGVTGNQGGAVAQALQGTGFYLRGLTRMPDSERAAALARHGVDVVKGDLDDEATLRRALAGAWGVFGVQNAGEAGVEREEAQGKRLATLAREAGVEHYVYTSVGSAHKRTGVPHFDNKWRIEETVRGLRFPSHVILRPVFFMENLLAPFSLQGSTLAWALGPGTKLQMIAVDDIGWFGARAFTDAAALNRREIVVKIKSTAVNHLDLVEASGTARQIFPLDLPWIPGHEFSGVVEQIGSEVAAYAPGDAVFGTTTGMGAYAEYLAVKAAAISRTPSNLSFG